MSTEEQLPLETLNTETRELLNELYPNFINDQKEKIVKVPTSEKIDSKQDQKEKPLPKNKFVNAFKRTSTELEKKSPIKMEWPKMNELIPEKKQKSDENEEEGDFLDLEFDSYVYLGVVLPDFILFAYDILSKLGSINSEKKGSVFHHITSNISMIYTRLFKLMMFGVLLIPGLTVPLIQIVVIGSFDKGNLDLDLIQNEKKLLSVAKIFMIFMFSCMALKECSNALKNWLHTIYFMKKLEKVSIYVNKMKKDHSDGKLNTTQRISYYLSNLSGLLPGLSQLLVSLFIQNYSTYIIVNCQTTVDLIANFAGLYVILEFDNLMIDFLKTSYLDESLVKYVNFIVRTMGGFVHEGGILVHLEKSVQKLFKNDSIHINEKKVQKVGDLKWIFRAHRIMTWIVLGLQFFVVAIPFWGY